MDVLRDGRRKKRADYCLSVILLTQKIWVASNTVNTITATACLHIVVGEAAGCPGLRSSLLADVLPIFFVKLTQ